MSILYKGAVLDKTKRLSESLFPPVDGSEPRNQLYRNDLTETGRLRFTDVTSKAAVGDLGYGMGVAVGDYDNDGDLDLYITNFGPNVLYQNNGDGTFKDITKRAGADDRRWSTGAAFLDYNLDGYLDLFVANYLAFTVEGNKRCLDALGERDYCSPSVEEPVPDRLFRNLGNGRFFDVTGEAGVDASFGAGLGVISGDFDSDGHLDIYVANDGHPNQLWINRGDGTFNDVGLLSGTAYNGDGQAEAGMGIAVADFNNDGSEDIFVTNLSKETNTLYVNDGAAIFFDSTGQFGLARPSLTDTGFGTGWLDYDNDGDRDLFVANGAVIIVESLRGQTFPFHQKNRLFSNEGGGRFRDVSQQAGDAFELSDVSRGTGFGDIDNDGDTDMVVGNNNGPARFLLNEVGANRHWLEVRLEAVKWNRYAIGARIAILRKNKYMWTRIRTGGSYLSASDVRAHFGLGSDPENVETIVVRWPDGNEEAWTDLSVDRIVTLRQGSGSPR